MDGSCIVWNSHGKVWSSPSGIRAMVMAHEDGVLPVGDDGVSCRGSVVCGSERNAISQHVRLFRRNDHGESTCKSLVCLAVAISAGGATAAELATEARGLWTHFTDMISPDPEQGRRDIEAIVDRMARARLNLLLPWVQSEYIAALMDPEFPRDTAVAHSGKVNH